MSRIDYLNEKIEELKGKIGEEPETPEQEQRTECWFIREFFLVPVQEAIEQRKPLSMEELHMMQQVVRGVYPYWLDNDEIYGLGRETLERLSLIGREFASQRDLDAYFEARLFPSPDERREKKPARSLPIGDEPLVSVILPTFNRCKELGKAMESVLNQTYPDLELIVVSDGSWDATEEVVCGFKDQRVRFIKSDHNGGPAYARNLGIRAARHELLAFHDDDDLWRPEKLEKQIKALQNADERTGFCYCEMEFHRLDGQTILYVPRRDISMVRKSGFLYPELLRRNFVGGPTLLIRRECLDEVGLFDERMAIFEDWDMVLRLTKRYDAAFVPEPLYDYYEHEKSLTTDRSEKHQRRIEETLRLFDEKKAEDKAAYGLLDEERTDLP